MSTSTGAGFVASVAELGVAEAGVAKPGTGPVEARDGARAGNNGHMREVVGQLLLPSAAFSMTTSALALKCLHGAANIRTRCGQTHLNACGLPELRSVSQTFVTNGAETGP